MPSVTFDAARALLAEHYQLEGRLSPLGGENQNLLVETSDQRRYVLKLATADRAVVEMECAAVEHAIAAGVDLALPRLVRTTSGDLVARGRLLTYVPGTPWYQALPATRDRRVALGRALATLDLAFAGFHHPAAIRTHRWDLTAARQHWRHVPLIDTPSRRRLADRLFQQWAAAAAPRVAILPRSFIHGDVNDENILVDGDRIVGLIDFGDALMNPTVCNLAIAVAYAMLDAGDPVADAAEIVAAYQTVRPLTPDEKHALFPLVCGRLATTVTVAAERRRIDPNHPRWFITEDRAWRLIERLDLSVRRGGPSGPPDPGRPEGRPLRTDLRRQHISAALSVSYREPLEIIRGEGAYLFDHRLRPYLDLVNNVCHVGHCHPRVVEAGQRQMARLNTNTRYLYDGLTTYAERLTATLPAPLEVVFLVNSGSEANELAVRLARAHTKRRDMLVVDAAYHGNTNMLVALSPYKFKGKGGPGVPEPWVHIAPIPDGYRGAHRGHDRATGEAYGDEVGRTIARANAPLAGFLVESIMSCAGQVDPPPGYLERAFQHVRAAGGVCIVDEVQTGFGRVGSHFWAFERQGVVPDIVVMGKPIGNGHPMGAVVTTREIAASFENGMEFFSTFGGNPVSCAVGVAVLDVIRDERLQERAATVGGRLADGLHGLASTHAIIGDVRGSGLFLGVELVNDRTTLEPATREAADLINQLKDCGMLLSTDGPFENVLKIKPPMVLTEDDVDMVVRSIDEALSQGL